LSEGRVRTELLSPGDRIGDRHEVVRFIAEGSSSDVYEARELGTGAVVAIKLLRGPNELDDEDPAARFEAEKSVCGLFESPYLVRVLDTGQLADSRPFLVMELLRGATLKERLSAAGRLPIDTAIELGRELFLALDAVHAAGVVHRDVKPRNILLHKDGESFALKLVDFGISGKLEAITAPDAARSEYAMGTPAYMSPEQLAGGSIDQRTDLYSAGVVLYEAITGRRPFEAPDIGTLTRSILFDPVLPPSLLRASCPPALEEAVMRCLERDRTRRPHTARTMVDALAGIAIASGRATGERAWLATPSTPPPPAASATGPTMRIPCDRVRIRFDF
jgi:serine/threonine-protein kinase